MYDAHMNKMIRKNQAQKLYCITVSILVVSINLAMLFSCREKEEELGLVPDGVRKCFVERHLRVVARTDPSASFRLFDVGSPDFIEVLHHLRLNDIEFVLNGMQSRISDDDLVQRIDNSLESIIEKRRKLQETVEEYRRAIKAAGGTQRTYWYFKGSGVHLTDVKEVGFVIVGNNKVILKEEWP